MTWILTGRTRAVISNAKRQKSRRDADVTESQRRHERVRALGRSLLVGRHAPCSRRVCEGDGDLESIACPVRIFVSVAIAPDSTVTPRRRNCGLYVSTVLELATLGLLCGTSEHIRRERAAMPAAKRQRAGETPLASRDKPALRNGRCRHELVASSLMELVYWPMCKPTMVMV